MNLICKVILLFLVVYFLPGDWFWKCGQQEELQPVSYQLPNNNVWVKNSKSLIDGTSYYQFEGDDSIRLKSIILSHNFFYETHSSSEKEIVEKLFSRKKSLFRVLGASDYKINSYKLTKKGKFKELDMLFQFYLKNKMSYIHEKYFIHPKHTLMVDLSWSSLSKEKQIQFAHREFAKINVTFTK
jgi:hypothetical protein